MYQAKFLLVQLLPLRHLHNKSILPICLKRCSFLSAASFRICRQIEHCDKSRSLEPTQRGVIIGGKLFSVEMCSGCMEFEGLNPSNRMWSFQVCHCCRSNPMGGLFWCWEWWCVPSPLSLQVALPSHLEIAAMMWSWYQLDIRCFLVG